MRTVENWCHTPANNYHITQCAFHTLFLVRKQRQMHAELIRVFQPVFHIREVLLTQYQLLSQSIAL